MNRYVGRWREKEREGKRKTWGKIIIKTEIKKSDFHFGNYLIKLSFSRVYKNIFYEHTRRILKIGEVLVSVSLIT